MKRIIVNDFLIKNLSNGEVTRSALTKKGGVFDKGGLFDAEIFGPLSVKKIGEVIIYGCDTRGRYGHIELGIKYVPKENVDTISVLLNVTKSVIQQYINYERYIAYNPEKDTYRFIREMNMSDIESNTEKDEILLSGGDALYVLLKHHADFDENYDVYVNALAENNLFSKLFYNNETQNPHLKDVKRIVRKITNEFLLTGLNPEDLVNSCVLVIPCAARPLQIEGKEILPTLNDYYSDLLRSVKQLQKLEEAHAPRIIILSAKRSIQKLAANC